MPGSRDISKCAHEGVSGTHADDTCEQEEHQLQEVAKEDPLKDREGGSERDVPFRAMMILSRNPPTKVASIDSHQVRLHQRESGADPRRDPKDANSPKRNEGADLRPRPASLVSPLIPLAQNARTRH